MFACITINSKIKAVLSRSLEIQYFLSRKCLLRAVSRKKWKNSKRADPAVYPAQSNKWQFFALKPLWQLCGFPTCFRVKITTEIFTAVKLSDLNLSIHINMLLVKMNNGPKNESLCFSVLLFVCFQKSLPSFLGQSTVLQVFVSFRGIGYLEETHCVPLFSASAIFSLRKNCNNLNI